MATPRIDIGALNIVASPHPPGIYRQLLTQIADKEVGLWGSDMAKITQFQPLEDRPNLLLGHILIWAEIDVDGKWINKRKNVEATPAEKQKVVEAIPPDLEPNFRSFNYIFIEDKHRLVLEFRNELGQSLGPSRAARLFNRLFENHLPADAPDVDVTIIPEDESLEKIFAIPRLRRLEILVKRPNPDDVAEAASRVLGRLTEQRAASQKIELTKAPKKKSLIPDEETKALAQLAVENGHVVGEGKDEQGKRVYESTEEHPKIRSFDLVGESSIATFLSSIRLF